jgi:hypothetical protein
LNMLYLRIILPVPMENGDFMEGYKFLNINLACKIRK